MFDFISVEWLCENQIAASIVMVIVSILGTIFGIWALVVSVIKTCRTVDKTHERVKDKLRERYGYERIQLAYRYTGDKIGLSGIGILIFGIFVSAGLWTEVFWEGVTVILVIFLIIAVIVGIGLGLYDLEQRYHYFERRMDRLIVFLRSVFSRIGSVLSKIGSKIPRAKNVPSLPKIPQGVKDMVEPTLLTILGMIVLGLVGGGLYMLYEWWILNICSFGS